jgi:hypothetical protein
MLLRIGLRARTRSGKEFKALSLTGAGARLDIGSSAMEGVAIT